MCDEKRSEVLSFVKQKERLSKQFVLVTVKLNLPETKIQICSSFNYLKTFAIDRIQMTSSISLLMWPPF